jgi:predicted metalloprotease with PDZ domain
MLLQVEVAFQGNSSGKTRIFLPNNWAGQEKLYESIVSIISLTPETGLEETEKSHVRLLIHAPDEWVRIKYAVKQQWSGPLDGRRFQKYWPNINKKYFHFIGLVFFVYPDRFRSGQINFEIRWKNFPSGWSIGNSFGCNQLYQKFTSTLENFRRSVYVGGDYRIRRILIENQPVFVALRGEEWGFTDSIYYKFVNKLVATERNFWEDHEFPYFLITLTPFGRGHRNSGGTGLYQSFDVFFYSDAKLNFSLKFLFAHELFHAWNTRGLGRRLSPEPLIYWFSEGFTDYYARLLLLRAGLITLEEYVSDYNAKLIRYCQSPVKEAPNQKILESYWTDEDIGRLPYQRGDVIAHRWNSLIKKRTEERYSLDAVMMDLFKRAQKGKQVLSHELLFEVLKALIGKEVEEDLKRYIEAGRLIELSGEELGPCFELNYTTPEKIPQYSLRKGVTYNAAEKCLSWFGIK